MSHNEFPPPPYSEQEFDQKLSQALALSAQQPPVAADEEEEWEQWSEAAFLAAEERNRASNGQGSSSRTLRQEHHHVVSSRALDTIEPLRIQKRDESGSKQRPNWMEHVDLISHGNPELPVNFSTTALSWQPTQSFSGPDYDSSSSSSVQPWHIPQPEILPDDGYESFSLPPPSFAAIGPPIDGLARLEYHPESTPPSPLASPVLDHHTTPRSDTSPPHLSPSHPTPFSGIYVDGYHNYTQRVPRHSLPTPPRSTNFHFEQRPTSIQNPRQISGLFNEARHSEILPSLSHKEQMAPMLSPPPIQNLSRLDHSSIVSNTHGKIVGRSITRTAYPTANAGSFYKPAVSAQLANSVSMRPRESPSHPLPLETTQLQPVRRQDVLRLKDHMNFPRNSVGTDINTRIDMSTQTLQVQQSSNASHFPQYPSHHTPMGSTPHRWAKSEQQINQSFR